MEDTGSVLPHGSDGDATVWGVLSSFKTVQLRILAEVVYLESYLLDGESCGKPPNSVLGTKGQDVLAQLS